jgi:hypothetical protein
VLPKTVRGDREAEGFGGVRGILRRLAIGAQRIDERAGLAVPVEDERRLVEQCPCTA